ncbi:MAG TPA: TIGR03905 family TSCPD domain-containing protein [Eubacteriales bacterium]|jgi:uncharacterized protein (TIGR03905 family)|nr:TIGR03905 family TSCPD domain-containing protein [Eubacteriales bacterium]HRU84824.1 TIGR03905 family TSCPD domain-containing protein [Eubacteriales bacterium]
MPSFRTRGTCSREIIFTVEDDKLYDLKFIGGCSGSLQAIARLTKGRPIDEVIEILKGIRCRNNTSCPDQLTKALLEYREKNPKPGEKL